MSKLEQSIEIDAPLATVRAVISDFARYPTFVPHVEDIEILDSPADGRAHKHVRFTVNLIKRIRYTLELRSTGARGLEWSLVEGPFERNDGGWRLEPLSAGRTRATYFIDARLSAVLPRFIEKRLIAQSLPEMLSAFRREAEQRAA